MKKPDGKPVPSFRWEDIDAIRQTSGLVGDDCPETAVTVGEYADKYGMSIHTAYSQLCALEKKGALKSGFSFRAEGVDGIRRRRRVYWPCGKS